MVVLRLGQALEGKNVKDMLLNVGSGGGAAAAAPTGGAAGGGAAAEAPAEKEEEKKEEGTSSSLVSLSRCGNSADTLVQRRRSRTRIWALVCSTEHVYRSHSSKNLAWTWDYKSCTSSLVYLVHH